MPIFHLMPVTARLDAPAWGSSPNRGEVWVNAPDAAQARALASGRYEDARANIPGVSSAASPWQDTGLVEATEVAEGPGGMDIPAGVVVSDRQM